MSDLSFVCVSADVDLAEALADVFETAGHTIGEREDDARGAIVIWSHAARRSEAFLDAAHRAIGAGKALVVSREGIAAASFDGAPVFDLGDWSGDPDAEVVASLTNAVDAKLVEARLAVAERVSADPKQFAPRVVRADFQSWKRGNFGVGNVMRALTVFAVLLAGALGAGVMVADRDPAAPAARAAVPSEFASNALLPVEGAAMHVTFTDAISTDASRDDVVPELAPLPGAGHGREPPSASSVPRRERTPPPYASWRDASYQVAPQHPDPMQLSYVPEPVEPLTLQAAPAHPPSQGKVHDKDQ